MTDPAAQLEYHFHRAKCLGWTLFSLVIVIACVVIAVLASDQRFVEGWVPGWLFGSLGGVLFLAVGSSWASRFLHTGPALVLGGGGIGADRRLGGLVTPRISGTIPWSEVESVAPGAHGSVVIQLLNPDAFWAGQSLLTRIVAWHPARGRRSFVSLGGNDLDAGQMEIVASLKSRIEAARLGQVSTDDVTLPTSEGTGRGGSGDLPGTA